MRTIPDRGVTLNITHLPVKHCLGPVHPFFCTMAQHTSCPSYRCSALSRKEVGHVAKYGSEETVVKRHARFRAVLDTRKTSCKTHDTQKHTLPPVKKYKKCKKAGWSNTSIIWMTIKRHLPSEITRQKPAWQPTSPVKAAVVGCMKTESRGQLEFLKCTRERESYCCRCYEEKQMCTHAGAQNFGP